MIAVVRATHASQFDELRSLFVEYEADLPQELRHGAIPETLELRSTYAGRNAAFLALSAGGGVGCVAVRELNDETAILLRLYVRAASRRLGAARRLTLAAIEFAKETAYRRVVLDTNKERLMSAYRLYRSLGFEECEPFAVVSYACPTFMELGLASKTSPKRQADDRI